MLSQNNILSGIVSTRKKQILVILSIVVFAFLIFLTFRTQNNKKQGEEYYDEGSGETIYNPKDRAPESYGAQSDRPIYLGFSKLLDYGISKFQLDSTKEAFYMYSKTNNNNLKEVSIFIDTIKISSRNRESPDLKQTASFEVKFNRVTTVKATLSYFDLRSIQLILQDSAGTQLFDSGIVDVYGSPD